MRMYSVRYTWASVMSFSDFKQKAQVSFRVWSEQGRNVEGLSRDLAKLVDSVRQLGTSLGTRAMFFIRSNYFELSTSKPSTRLCDLGQPSILMPSLYLASPGVFFSSSMP